MGSFIDEHMDATLISMIALCVVLVGGCFWFAIEESNEWVAFKSAHHCEVIGYSKGHIVNTFDGKNVGVAYTGDSTGYVCDDGKQYWR